MSGHSKWSTIKRKKGAIDAKRGKIFTKMIREITVAAREGGPDPEGNPRLRRAMDTAKAANMPNDNMNRAIKKATGAGADANSYEEITLEGYGPGGIAILIEALTDNRNRTLAEIRHALSKNGGSMGEPGCVAWMFEKKGIIRFSKEKYPEEDQLMEPAIEAGAEDLKDEGEVWEVITEMVAFDAVRKALEDAGFEPTEAELAALPKDSIEIAGKEAEQMMKLLEAVEDQDDTQNVYSNMDISEEEMEKMMA